MKAFAASAFGCALLVGLAGCTGSGADGDEDGLQDVIELDGWAVTITLTNGDEETRLATSSPEKRDTDRDGVGDAEERILRWDASNPDTDGDGLLDGSDMVLDADDRLAATFDRMEIVSSPEENGQLRYHGERPRHTNPLNQDSDVPEGDGLADGDEVRGYDLRIMGTEIHLATDPFSWDSDGDFLSDAEELDYGTHPREADTDGDGVSDDRDLNPFGNLRLDVRYKTIRMFEDKDQAEPLKAADLYLDAYLPGFTPHRSPEIDVAEGSDVDITAISPGILDVRDDGANFRDRDFNLTLSIFAFDRDAASSSNLDLHSRTTDFGQLNVVFDVRSGTWRIEGTTANRSGDVSTEGADGRLVLSLRAV